MLHDNNRIVQLDGLRFFAVVMVMFAHWMQWQWTNPILKVFPFTHGVTLFFVLSGFLITTILLKANQNIVTQKVSASKAIKQFYIRRSLRIMPMYYLLLVFLFFIDYKNIKEIFPWLVTYTSNIYQYINLTFIGDFNHFWSLAVEEQFYLFWPLMIVFLGRKHPLVLIASTIIISLLARVSIFVFTGNWLATSYATICCMSTFGVGALLAYIKMYKSNWLMGLSKPIWLYGYFVVYVVTFFLLHNQQWYKETLDEILFAVLASLIILRASTNGFKGIFKWVLENPSIVYSGKISYGLYVYHLFIPTLYFWLTPKFGFHIDNKYVYFLAYYLLTFLLAWVSWKMVESPIQTWRNKRFLMS
ncbi:MAG: acyltransferase [Bacteroidia bacterium]|nr:acyltransferase [Bacteroidia bacterium]